MNISQVSIPINVKKADAKAKGEPQLGKVIAKNGKEIQVLIKDKVYKIEPGNAGKIKTGDMIQVFFGKDLPQEISDEVLKKIGAKLLDVFSLSLPFKTTQELETLINKMPQAEKMYFARVSNQISQLAEAILTEDFNMELKETVENTKNAFDLYDSRLPFNRRLIEISLKVKAMGEAWDQIPDKIKKEIIKEFVLFDLKKMLKSESDSVDNLAASEKKETTNISKKEPSQVKEHNDLLLKKNSIEKFPKKTDIPEKKNSNQARIKNGTFTSKNEATNNTKPQKFTPAVEELPSILKDNKSNSFDDSIKKADIRPQTQNHSGNVTVNKNTLEGNQQINVGTINREQTEETPVQIKTLPKEEMIKQTVNELKELLKELISKPVTLEKNHNVLSFISNKSTSLEPGLKMQTVMPKVSPKELTLKLEQTLQKTAIPVEDKNILNIMNKLVSTENEGVIKFDSIKINREIFSSLIGKEFSFEAIKNDPMMKFEIKNLLRQLNNLGLSPKETVTMANDIVNIAVRSFKEPDTAQNIFPNSLKNYLKLKLPQLIIDNKVPRSNEGTLISKIQSFSQKAYIIVKDFVHKLITSPDESTTKSDANFQKTETTENKLLSENTSTVAKRSDESNQIAQNRVEMKGLTLKEIAFRPKEMPSNLTSTQKAQLINTLEESKAMNDRGKEILITKNNIKINDPVNLQSIKNFSTDAEKSNENQNANSEEKASQIGLPEKNEINSEKLLKMLNITSDKNEFNHVYSALLNFNDQYFAVDFQKQSVSNSGYDKSEMYRVYIETDTQRFGNVFIDTIVTGENLDIYIYAGQEHTSEFTNHSSVLSKRIKETDYKLRSLLIKEKANQNDILKHKVKMYTGIKKDGGFFKLA